METGTVLDIYERENSDRKLEAAKQKLLLRFRDPNVIRKPWTYSYAEWDKYRNSDNPLVEFRHELEPMIAAHYGFIEYGFKFGFPKYEPEIRRKERIRRERWQKFCRWLNPFSK